MLISRLFIGPGITVFALLTITNNEWDFTLGRSFRITWQGAQGPVRIQAVYSDDDSSVILVASGVTATSYTWTPPLSMRVGPYIFTFTDGQSYDTKRWTLGRAVQSRSTLTTSTSSTSSILSTSSRSTSFDSSTLSTSSPPPYYSPTSPTSSTSSTSSPSSTSTSYSSSTSSNLPTSRTSSTSSTSSISSTTSLTTQSSPNRETSSTQQTSSTSPPNPITSDGIPEKPSNRSKDSDSPRADGLNTAAKVGIGVSCSLLGLALLFGLGLLIYRFGKRAGSAQQAWTKPELSGDSQISQTQLIHELDATNGYFEIDTDNGYREFDTHNGYYEVDAIGHDKRRHSERTRKQDAEEKKSSGNNS